MLKHKWLVKAVMLSVVSCGLLPVSISHAAIGVTLTDSQDIHYYTGLGGTSWSVDGTLHFDAPHYTDDEINNVGVYLGGSNDKIINFINDNQDEQWGLVIDYNTGAGESVGLENYAPSTTCVINNNNGLNIDNSLLNGHTTAENIEKQYGILNLSGDLEINGGVVISLDSGASDKFGIDNEVGNKLTINDRLYIGDSAATGEVIAVLNKGIFNITGDYFGIYNADQGILNMGSGEVNIDVQDVYIVDRAKNTQSAIYNDTGKMTITSKSFNAYGDIYNNAGKMTITSKSFNVYGDIYNNNGSLQVDFTSGADLNNNNTITGDIYHLGDDAVTDITLKSSKTIIDGTEYVVDSTLVGNIKGSANNDNFNLTLESGSVWVTKNQSEVMSGLTLNGGVVSLADDIVSYWYPSAKNWDSIYSNLKLKNFKSNGSLEGGFIVYTDLINDLGDSVLFEGATPNTDVNFLIVNKDDNNGVPIQKSDGHSVTIASAPIGTAMNIKADYMYVDLPDDDGIYVYKPTIEVETDEFRKNWNFVGWNEGDAKNVDGETKQQENDPNINIIDIDNTFKRLNDIRTDPSEVGVWIRGERGKTKISSYGYEYSLTSGGYDWIHENDNANIFAGVGISYSQNDCDTGIIGDTKSLGFNLYGSWYGKKNNDYVDVIVKYGRLDKEYAGYDVNGVFVAGDYDKDLFSVAAKYGRRFTQKNGWYYEPFAGLTWGRVGSADFVDSQKVRIHADSSTSKIAMLGMQVGKNVKGMEYYGKVEVRHDFDGKMHVSAPDSTLPGAHAYEDMGGTWCKLALGASRKINSNNSFYLDVEKDFGNKVKKPYAVSFGYRYTW